jgi:hypothetical protein
MQRLRDQPWIKAGGDYSRLEEKSTMRIDSLKIYSKGIRCPYKNLLEMGIVASNKKVLEINVTYRHWQQPVGGGDEAHDTTASGGGGQDGESLSAQPQKREEVDLERAGRVDGLQSCFAAGLTRVAHVMERHNKLSCAACRHTTIMAH